MKRFFDFFLNIRVFLSEVRDELRKSAWPTWGELNESTFVVIISVVMLAAFVGISDTMLASLVRLMMR